MRQHTCPCARRFSWRATLRKRPLLGVKRTCPGALQMSAFDPKRTFRKRTVRIRLNSRLDIPLNRQRIPPDMNNHEDIAKALKIRLSELTSRVAEIDSELRKPLSADSEDRATDLENQYALEGIEISEIREIRQIDGALKRIAEGTYGVCSQCGGDIDPKRLRAMPTATRCISCAA